MGGRLTKCQLPSVVGTPPDDSTAALAQFYTTITDRARAILTRAGKSHGLRWVEFDLTDPNAGEVLAKTVPGGGRPSLLGPEQRLLQKTPRRFHSLARVTATKSRNDIASLSPFP